MISARKSARQDPPARRFPFPIAGGGLFRPLRRTRRVAVPCGRKNCCRLARDRAKIREIVGQVRGAARQGQDTLPGPLPQGGGLVVAPRGLPPRQAGPSSVGEIAAALPSGVCPDRHPPGGGGGYEGIGPSYPTAPRRGSPEEESFSRCSRRRDGVTHIGLPPEEGRGKYFPKRFCALFILVLDKKL